MDLRVVHLSGIWPQVYQSYLQAGRDGVGLGGMVSDFVLGSYVPWRDGVRGGMVSDFVLGSYVPSSKPKTKSDTCHYQL